MEKYLSGVQTKAISFWVRVEKHNVIPVSYSVSNNYPPALEIARKGDIYWI